MKKQQIIISKEFSSNIIIGELLTANIQMETIKNARMHLFNNRNTTLFFLIQKRYSLLALKNLFIKVNKDFLGKPWRK